MTTTDTRPISLRQGHIEKVRSLFADPPALATVAAESAQAYLDLHFAEGNYNAGHLQIAGPTGPYRSVTEWILERLAAGRATLLVEQYHRAATRVREIYVPSNLSLAQVEVLINHCGGELLKLYARRLQAWWREAVAVNTKRWGNLSDQLLALLYDSPRPPGMSAQRFALVLPKSLLHPRRPNRQWSAHGPKLRVQTVHVRVGSATQMLPLLLFSQPSDPGVVLFSPVSGVQVLDNLGAVQALLPAHASPLLAPLAGEWFAVDAQDDPFDALAASCLQRQLLEIASLDFKVPRSIEDYQRLLAIITDYRRWFEPNLSARQQYLRDHLPPWLAHADSDACIDYAQLLQALVLDRQQHGYQHFLDGIPTLRSYADERLQGCLGKEPRAANIKPADIEVTFERVLAAAVPVPGGFIAGEVHNETLSLTDLALDNLAGHASTAKSISLKGATAPTWLTYDLLKACVTEVDIGEAYPALLKKHLIDDPADAARRSQRFSQQLRIQLPMQALEWQIKGEHGLTRLGFRRLRTALQASAAERKLDGREMAVWPLAFKATATSAADRVANMFIIGPQQDEEGDHLLYRPLFEPSLQAFSSLTALLDAIKQPGPLQDSVLTWIDARRQAVYANNGFREPHVRHFLPGDEFTVYQKPAPVQLSKTVSNLDPTHQLFSGMAQALVTLADRQSVSNSEQRWASIRQIGWLLFGTLQPLLSGPLMLVGWLVQLMDSVEQDIAGLQSADLKARNMALMDMLANLMVVLAHQATPHDVRQHLALEHPVFAPLAVADKAPVAPALKLPPAGFTAPSGWANARNTLTPALQARLQAMSVKRFNEPWPKALPGAEKSGPWQGLLRDAQQTPARWDALVRGHQYRVRIEEQRVRVVSADGNRLGPWLESVAPGVWDVDLQLRLSGGADGAAELPPDPHVLEEQYRQAIVATARAQRAMEIARHLAEQPLHIIDDAQRARVQASYSSALESKVEHLRNEAQLLRRLRDLAPRPRYEQELSELLYSTLLCLQLLDSRLRVQLQQTSTRLLPLLNLGEEAYAELNRGMRELAASYERVIHWRIMEERCFEELRQVPRFGRRKATLAAETIPARASILDLQSLQLGTLAGLAIDVPGAVFEPELLDSLKHTFARARWATRSLAELPQLHASDAEQIELLDSVDHVLAQTDDRIELWRTTEPGRFDAESLGKLQVLLGTLREQVERDLGARLEPASPEPPSPPPPTPLTPVVRRKKIIRTRNRDLIVVGTDATSSHTAQLTDASGSVIGTFTEADDGVWEQQPATPTPRPDPELGSLLKNAETLVQDVDGDIAKVGAATARDPASLQHLLEAQARRRLWVADAIRKKLLSLEHARLAAVQQAKARSLETQLRAAVVRLNEAGLAARIRATLAITTRPLTQDEVAFLHQHHEISIVRRGPRSPLAGPPPEFLQEYAVNSAHTGKTLGFAHFHYKKIGDFDDYFTAAHLKTVEQVRMGRQAQAQVEAQAFARIRSGQGGRVPKLEIHRAEIQLQLARRLFFSVD